MKKLLLIGLLAGLAVSAYAQGLVALNNIDNSSSAPSTATSGGLFFLDTGSGPNPITTDFNVVFTMGPASGPTTTVSFIGAAAAGGNFGPGLFYDSSGNGYAVPGQPNGSCTMTIQAWLGSSTTYAGAVTKGTATFQQVLADPTAVPPPTPPSLIDMPSIILSGAAPVPEPSTFALAGLGAAALLIFRRRK
jgi:hypothetical protein